MNLRMERLLYGIKKFRLDVQTARGWAVEAAENFDIVRTGGCRNNVIPVHKEAVSSSIQ